MSVTSLDPGKRTGWAKWSEEGVLLDHGILFLEEMLEYLRTDDSRVYVVEDFVLDHRAGKQKGSRLEASQVIGAVKMRARQTGAIVMLQRTESRDMGYVHAGLVSTSRHDDSHDRDAVAHGFWWWEAERRSPSLGAHDHLRTKTVSCRV